MLFTASTKKYWIYHPSSNFDAKRGVVGKLYVATVKMCLKAEFIPFSDKMTKYCEYVSIHQRDDEKAETLITVRGMIEILLND